MQVFERLKPDFAWVNKLIGITKTAFEALISYSPQTIPSTAGNDIILAAIIFVI